MMAEFFGKTEIGYTLRAKHARREEEKRGGGARTNRLERT